MHYCLTHAWGHGLSCLSRGEPAAKPSNDHRRGGQLWGPNIFEQLVSPGTQFQHVRREVSANARIIAPVLYSQFLLLIGTDVTSLVERSCHIPGDDVCLVEKGLV